MPEIINEEPIAVEKPTTKPTSIIVALLAGIAIGGRGGVYSVTENAQADIGIQSFLAAFPVFPIAVICPGAQRTRRAILRWVLCD